jgi:hypothetical protein
LSQTAKCCKIDCITEPVPDMSIATFMFRV